MIWINILFFLFTAGVTLIAGPYWIAHHGLSPFIAGLTFFYAVATGMSITAGYHRCFSHATFKAHPIVQFFFLFFGAAAFEQSALYWSSQHRDHHRYVDTDLDPYSIKKGFFYAHIGWLLFWEHTIHFDNVKDLQKNAMVMNQSKYYLIWALTAGVALPVAAGWLHGEAAAAFIFAVCARLFIVHHSTFCINSICHMFGKATYDIYSSAKDHWFIAFLTNGEGYHNFHHRFPGDYRNGVRWYQWDPSKWLIAFLSSLRLAYDLKTVSKFRILEARIKAERQRVCDWALNSRKISPIEKFFEEAEFRYQILYKRLIDWEQSAREYRGEVTALAARKMDEARQCFKREQAVWRSLMRSNPALAPLV